MDKIYISYTLSIIKDCHKTALTISDYQEDIQDTESRLMNRVLSEILCSLAALFPKFLIFGNFALFVSMDNI